MKYPATKSANRARWKIPRRLKRIGCVILLLPCAVVSLFLAAIGPLPLPDSPKALPATFPADFQKGIPYESWWHGEYSRMNSDATLAQLIKPAGANWIAIIVKCAQATLKSTQIICDTNKTTSTDDDI